MLSLKIFFALVVSSTASRIHTLKPAADMSAKCQEETKKLQTKEKVMAATDCEEKHQYPQQAIKLLQDGDKAAAVSIIEEDFQKCGEMSEQCAKELAPVVIQQLQFSGAAVADECKQEVDDVKNSALKSNEADQCEQKEKVYENALVALNNKDLDGAIKIAENSLKKCMKLSDRCASQIAPVVVNQVVMRAMMEQEIEAEGEWEKKKKIPQTTVFMAATAAALVPPAAEMLSLVRTLADDTDDVATASRSGKQAPQLSPKCKEELKKFQTKERVQASTACEKKHEYPQQAIKHLQDGDKPAAVSVIEESFQKCAKLSEQCASELAPVVIQQLLFSGAAVTDSCKQKVTKIQSNTTKNQEVAQ